MRPQESGEVIVNRGIPRQGADFDLVRQEGFKIGNGSDHDFERRYYVGGGEGILTYPLKKQTPSNSWSGSEETLGRNSRGKEGQENSQHDPF